ncbi:hypothetical protein HX109_13615 [Galbibacter sp. BG1]|uniref:hypothetical protein n=1 Tax=Galbibacter sp. BG1 TaxID=1170699 RepID=UPI0015B9C8DD|nr:hypothetical protein [Galbibacter sp. BG1]QLE02546.1 hypothetical protein HX109_13615 [Galbibacter sp. BG1]
MNTFFRILAIVMAFSSISHAQDFTLIASDSPKEYWCNYSDNGNLYTFTYGDSKTGYKTKVTTYNKDLEVISELTSSETLDGNDIYYISKDGTEFAFDRYGNEDRIGVLTPSGYFKVKTSANHHCFTTKDFYHTIEVKENVLGNKQGMELLVANLKKDKIETYALEHPKFKGEETFAIGVMDYGPESFKYGYINLNSEEKNYRNYIVVEYDFKGKIIKQQSFEVSLQEAEFSFLNDDDRAYSTFVYSGSSSVVTAVHNPKANGVLRYDAGEDVYYAYGGYEKRRDVSGVFIHKYDATGKLLWEQRYLFDDFKLKYLNSYNRLIRLDIGSQNIGFNVYTRKGKDYCGFYLVDKQTGELKNSSVLDNYGFYGGYKSTMPYTQDSKARKLLLRTRCSTVL